MTAADSYQRFIDLLRNPDCGEGAALEELHSLSQKFVLDANVLLALAYRSVPEEKAIQFSNRLLHARSGAARATAADHRAAEIRKLIEEIRRREGDVPNSVLAARLNAMRIPAPRGGAWVSGQVIRVLKRTSHKACAQHTEAAVPKPNRR